MANVSAFPAASGTGTADTAASSSSYSNTCRSTQNTSAGRLSLQKHTLKKSRKYTVFRSRDLHSVSAAISPGPLDLTSLMNWPERHCKDLWDSDDGGLLMSRAEALLQQGVMLHSDFSGQLCAEAGLRMQLRGMISHGANLKESSLCSWAACESNRTCQDIIRKSPCKPMHLFRDVLHHLPTEHAEELKKLRPDMSKGKVLTQVEKIRRHEDARAAFSNQEAYINERMDSLFLADRKANCIMHGGAHCFMMWQKLSDVPLDQQPLKWNMSGPMCTPYTIMGDRKLGADPSMESWHTWSASVAASDHDLATCENSDEMPEELFDGKMMLAGPHAWFVVPLILNTTDRQQ